MAATSVRGPLKSLHPLHAILLAFTFPLFLGALVSDLAYRSTFQVQWSNFSAWLIAGGLLVSAFAVLWALIYLFRHPAARQGRALVYAVTLLVMWLLGFLNALEHAKDAWATMPAGLYLSIIVTILALVASWIGYSGFRTEEVR